MIIIIIITLTEIFTVSSLRRELSPTRSLVARAQWCANHVQHNERFSRAACRVPRDTKGQLCY